MDGSQWDLRHELFLLETGSVLFKYNDSINVTRRAGWKWSVMT